MKPIPYVIDNQTHRLADILNELLANHAGKSLDIASAYFNIQGFRLLKDGLNQLGHFRLLLGAEPGSGEQLGLQAQKETLLLNLRSDLERAPFDEETLILVEELIRFLRKEQVAVRLYEDGFLHAKCYLFYNDSADKGWDRFQPVVGIVGSSNFTQGGLTSNRELNLAHKTVLSDAEVLSDKPVLSDEDPASLPGLSPEELEARRKLKSSVGAHAIAELDLWFERQWGVAKDFKDALIELLDESKFGEKEYTPYQIYMKTLYEYLKDELSEEEQPAEKRSAVELTEFQDDAVKKARKILSRYDGVMVADSVGLGKTWIGKKLLEDYAYHLRENALVVCPASLRQMWKDELLSANIATEIISQEELGRATFEPEEYGEVDVILIDESHNFRNNGSQRYENLERIIAQHGGRGSNGQPKKLILLTATPINNDVMDLFHQINLFTRGDRSYFAAAGIGNLHRYFVHARQHRENPSATLFNLLEEVVIRRTRRFIKEAYPEATINGKKIHFPRRKLRTERYDLEKTYDGIYQQVVNGIESLHLAPFNLESYKKKRDEIDEWTEGRGQALVGIFKTLYLKRFESSVEAFRISLHRALEFLKTFESYILDGKVLSSGTFRKILPLLEREEEEDDATPASRAGEIDASEEAQEILEELDTVAPSAYNLRALHEAVQKDIDTLTGLFNRVKEIKPENDAKLQKFRELLAGPLKGKKVIVFSYFKDTAKYLNRQIKADASYLKKLGNPHIRLMDSDVDTPDRKKVVQAFAPKANHKPEWVGSEKEIDILFSTDVLSEGQNLQDCAHLVNYDLHWNPTRMVQRAGRIDRIGTDYDTLFVYNMFPDKGLENLLRLVEKLQSKIAKINEAGMLDASVLGETVHPKNFNTLKRIEEGDESVMDEEEAVYELASHEFMLKELATLIHQGKEEELSELPDGIHSGLVKPGAKGMFFYFKARRKKGESDLHFWRYYDLSTKQIMDNRLLISNLIACRPDTERVVADYDIFDIHNQVVADILKSQGEQESLQAAPKTIDPLQQTVGTVLQSIMNRSDVKRPDVIKVMRYLQEPMTGVEVKELRKVYNAYLEDSDARVLVEKCLALQGKYGGSTVMAGHSDSARIGEDNLHLVCFDLLS